MVLTSKDGKLSQKNIQHHFWASFYCGKRLRKNGRQLNIEANYYIIIVEVRNIFSIFLYG